MIHKESPYFYRNILGTFRFCSENLTTYEDALTEIAIRENLLKAHFNNYEYNSPLELLIAKLEIEIAKLLAMQQFGIERNIVQDCLQVFTTTEDYLSNLPCSKTI